METMLTAMPSETPEIATSTLAAVDYGKFQHGLTSCLKFWQDTFCTAVGDSLMCETYPILVCIGKMTQFLLTGSIE